MNQGNGYDPTVDAMKQRNREVFQETLAICKAGGYRTPAGKEIRLPEAETVRKSSAYYIDPPSVSDKPTAADPAVDVVMGDCIDVARELKESGFNPVMLNMANRTTPGGGVLDGARAQEETLFRRSNLCVSLYQYNARLAPLVGVEPAKEQYPMDRNTGGIYSGQIMFFRKSVDADYDLDANPYVCSVVSAAAISHPELKPDGRMTDAMAEATKRKMRTVLRIGLLHGHDAIVLGAWGCGAFRNPPSHIAELFKEVLAEEEFARKYRRVRLAIIEDHNSNNRNLKAFQDVFG